MTETIGEEIDTTLTAAPGTSAIVSEDRDTPVAQKLVTMIIQTVINLGIDIERVIVRNATYEFPTTTHGATMRAITLITDIIK